MGHRSLSLFNNFFFIHRVLLVSYIHDNVRFNHFSRRILRYETRKKNQFQILKHVEFLVFANMNSCLLLAAVFVLQLGLGSTEKRGLDKVCQFLNEWKDIL